MSASAKSGSPPRQRGQDSIFKVDYWLGEDVVISIFIAVVIVVVTIDN
jgi:hypothetical protein